ncbi:hypothetical protein P3T36_002603 [Kitasatospora sp. MAP12-15]|nr:hypothetical protein [Kitasatospora sp. MAP12-44]
MPCRAALIRSVLLAAASGEDTSSGAGGSTVIGTGSAPGWASGISTWLANRFEKSGRTTFRTRASSGLSATGALPGEPVVLATQTANLSSMRLAAKLGFTEAERYHAWGAEQWVGVGPPVPPSA